MSTEIITFSFGKFVNQTFNPTNKDHISYLNRVYSRCSEAHPELIQMKALLQAPVQETAPEVVETIPEVVQETVQEVVQETVQEVVEETIPEVVEETVQAPLTQSTRSAQEVVEETAPEEPALMKKLHEALLIARGDKERISSTLSRMIFRPKFDKELFQTSEPEVLHGVSQSSTFIDIRVSKHSVYLLSQRGIWCKAPFSNQVRLYDQSVTSRFTKIPEQYEEMDLFQYSCEKYSPGNVQHKPGDMIRYPLINKYAIENNINFGVDDLSSIRVIYYDIETSMNLYSEVPDYHDRGAQINLIQVLSEYRGKREYTLLFLGEETPSINLEKIRHISKITDPIEIRFFRSETALCRAFIDLINSYPEQKFLGGFNSSSGRENVKDQKLIKPGYDLPFILERANILYQLDIKKLMLEGQAFYQAFSCQGVFPSTYIVDFKLLFTQALNPSEVKETTRRNLDTFLTLWGLENKQNSGMSYAKIQEVLRTKDSKHINEVLAYGLVDCRVLAEANHEKMILQNIVNEQKMLNLPLSFLLLNTRAQNLNYFFHRKYFERGLIFPYQMCYDRQKFFFRGALTYSENKSVVRENAIQVDFESQYPNSSITNNISPETIIDSIEELPDSHKVHQVLVSTDFKMFELLDERLLKRAMNTHEQEILEDLISAAEKRDANGICGGNNITTAVMLFDGEREGVFPETQRILFEQRKALKAQMKKLDKSSIEYKNIDSLQQVKKLLINSIYGVTGSQISPFFDVRCSMSTTAFGRTTILGAFRVIEKIFGTRPISIETDSVTAEFPQFRVPSNKMQLQDVIDQLNMNLHSLYGPRMTMSCEEIFIRIMSNMRKSYIRLEIPISKIGIYADLYQYDSTKYLQAVEAGEQEKLHDLKIKGFSYSQYTVEQRHAIQNLIEQVMISAPVGQDQEAQKQVIESILKEFTRKHIQAIQKAVKTKDIKALEFYQIVKNVKSKNNITLENFCARYGLTEQRVPIVQLSCNGKKTEHMIPFANVQPSDLSKIDREHHLKHFISPIRKFFFDFLGQRRVLKAEVQSNDYEYYRASVTNKSSGRHVDQYFTQEQLVQLIEENGHNTQIDLAFTEYNLCCFDVESYTSLEPTARAQQEQIILDTIKRELRVADQQIHVAAAHNSKKFSLHIVVDVSMHIEENKQRARLLNSQMRGTMLVNQNNIFDLNIYRSNGQLRMPNCIKIENNQVIDRKFNIITPHSKLTNFIFSNQQPTQLFIQSDKHPLFNVVSKIYQAPGQTEPVVLTEEISGATQLSDLEFCQCIERIKRAFKFQDLNYNPFSIQTFKHQQYNQITMHLEEFECPLCEIQHHTQNQYFILTKKAVKLGCHGFKGKNIEVKDAEQSQDSALKSFENREYFLHALRYNQDLQDFPFSDEQHSQLVHYDLDSDITGVQAGMGTGKTIQLIEHLSSPEYKDKTILIISFRISFTQQLQKKLAAIGFESYQEIKGGRNIDLKQHPKVIIQVESLSRLCYVQETDLIVIDEAESVLNQLNQPLQQSQKTNIQLMFIRTLKVAKKLLLLDAFLEPSTLRFFQKVCPQLSSYQVITNTYKRNLRKDGSLIPCRFEIIDKKDDTILRIMKTIMHKVISAPTKKFAIFCSYQGKAEQLFQLLQDYGIKSVLYSGKDYQQIENTTMRQLKQTHFKDIENSVSQYQVILYTSTITAGISIEETEIEEFFGIYLDNSCDPLGFMQSTQRFRQINNYSLFIQTAKVSNNSFQNSVSHYSKEFLSELGEECFDNSEVRQMEIFLYARAKAQTSNKLALLAKYISRQGFTLSEIQPDTPILQEEVVLEKTRHELIEAMQQNVQAFSEKLAKQVKPLQDSDSLLEVAYKHFCYYVGIHQEIDITKLPEQEQRNYLDELLKHHKLLRTVLNRDLIRERTKNLTEEAKDQSNLRNTNLVQKNNTSLTILREQIKTLNTLEAAEELYALHRNNQITPSNYPATAASLAEKHKLQVDPTKLTKVFNEHLGIYGLKIIMHKIRLEGVQAQYFKTISNQSAQKPLATKLLSKLSTH